MPALLEQPVVEAVRVPCDACGGTRFRPSEWDISTGAVTAMTPCTTCLFQGWLLVTPKGA